VKTTRVLGARVSGCSSGLRTNDQFTVMDNYGPGEENDPDDGHTGRIPSYVHSWTGSRFCKGTEKLRLVQRAVFEPAPRADVTRTLAYKLRPCTVHSKSETDEIYGDADREQFPAPSACRFVYVPLGRVTFFLFIRARESVRIRRRHFLQ